MTIDELKNTHIELVPQYDEYGMTEYEMMTVGHETFPNLIINRDMSGGVWVVYQAAEFEDDYVLIGRANVACEGLRFLRRYSEEEENLALAELLTTSDKTWSCC